MATFVRVTWNSCCVRGSRSADGPDAGVMVQRSDAGLPHTSILSGSLSCEAAGHWNALKTSGYRVALGVTERYGERNSPPSYYSFNFSFRFQFSSIRFYLLILFVILSYVQFFFFPYVRPLSNIFFLFGFVKFECDVDYVCSLRGLWNDFKGIRWRSIFNFVIFVKGLFIIWTLIYYIRFRRKKIYSSKWDEKDYWKWYFFAVCFVYSISKINF